MATNRNFLPNKITTDKRTQVANDRKIWHINRLSIIITGVVSSVENEKLQGASRQRKQITRKFTKRVTPAHLTVVTSCHQMLIMTPKETQDEREWREGGRKKKGGRKRATGLIGVFFLISFSKHKRIGFHLLLIFFYSERQF